MSRSILIAVLIGLMTGCGDVKAGGKGALPVAAILDSDHPGEVAYVIPVSFRYYFRSGTLSDEDYRSMVAELSEFKRGPTPVTVIVPSDRYFYVCVGADGTFSDPVDINPEDLSSGRIVAKFSPDGLRPRTPFPRP